MKKKPVTSKKPAPTSYTVKLKYLQALRRFASKEETRYYLMGVNIEFTKRGAIYTATDGHRLVSAIDRRTTYKKEFSLIVPGEFCKTIKLTKAQRDEDGTLRIDGKEAVLTIGADDYRFKPIDGDYPIWRAENRIAPQKISGKVAQFNHRYLKDFDDLSDDCDLGGAIVHHNGPNEPCPITFQITADVIGFLMPMRRGDAPYQRPDWCEAA